MIASLFFTLLQNEQLKLQLEAFKRMILKTDHQQDVLSSSSSSTVVALSADDDVTVTNEEHEKMSEIASADQK